VTGTPGDDRGAEAEVVANLLELARERGLVLDLVDAAPDARGRWRNRTYRLHLQPALWGGVDVVRTWGRRGTTLRRPRRLVTHHLDGGTAEVALAAVIRRRLRRGYAPARLA
jgi:predicted DNA-binding WGR domain protein